MFIKMAEYDSKLMALDDLKNYTFNPLDAKFCELINKLRLN